MMISYLLCFFSSSFLYHVVKVVGRVELGELLCDSLEDAPASTLLRFAISSNEVSGEHQGIGRAVSCTRKCQRYSGRACN